MQSITFDWIDYLVFCTLLGVSLVIGLYFGFLSKQDTTNEYLYGGKKMGCLPVAVSLLSSFLSGITFLGLPTEIYLYGSTYLSAPIGAAITALVTIYIFLPVFFKLQLSCINEYLELRFSKSVRKLSSVAYLIGLLASTSLIIYVPALAFSQVTNYSIHVITPVLTIICITYTSMGGVKAVIWTDTFQFFFTVIGVVSVFGIGLNEEGGFSRVWSIASEGNRTRVFDMDPSLFKRTSFWAVQSAVIMGSVARFSIGQKYVQKFLSVPTEKDAVKAIVMMTVGWIGLIIVCMFTGLIMYVKYLDCDPHKAGFVERSDQTLVYFVMDVAGHIRGLPGIFLAGLVSSSLATMSACLNTFSGMLYDDFIDQWLPASNKRESRAANIMKFNVVLAGVLSISLVLVMEKLGTIFEMVYSVTSILDAPIFTLFTLGILIPWTGKKGALAGGLTTLIFMMWLVGGSQWHVMNKRIQYEQFPTSTDGCDASLNISITSNSTLLEPIDAEDEPFFMFRISVFYFTLIGSFLGITVGVVTSYLTKEIDTSTVNPDHISPFLHRFLPKKKYIEVHIDDIKSPSIKENGYFD
ncbi:sodium-coupled monocarboxylate transporter 2-like [Trichogramma pretiosum]|uniref:sodium-coupled monocarboxylate transporter 2-like n=1 Tax=Trichogramma pretiosum TaxID=7493 RepID=UPI0006C9BA20|nr:sodium-coupled monocarboxylate transporter 2-like [Trichogramma pretiosum]